MFIYTVLQYKVFYDARPEGKKEKGLFINE
ncbi:hypothetical protein X965_16105 [Morganella sp. EGD-HP17]|nr:hypothetical protein X965_16105 [Morganella sp. EGD-HP17]